MKTFKMLGFAGLLAAALAFSAPARAQVVVATCGTIPATPAIGYQFQQFVFDQTGKLCVNEVVSATVTFPTFGAAAPATGIANGLSDGTNLQPWLTALPLGDGVNGNNTGAVAPWVYNGATWDRMRGSAAYGVTVSAAGQSFTNIATATDTVIKASAGTFVGLIINTGGVGSAATVYNNTTCTGAKIGTFSTAAQGAVAPINAAATVGMCVTTAGGTPADITVLWR